MQTEEPFDVTARSDVPRSPFASLQELTDRDPFPDYEAMRANGPVVWDTSMNAWLVLDFKLCRYVELHEEDLFRSIYADADPMLVEIKGGRTNITITQGESHQRLRRFHMSLLSFKALESYRRNIVTPIVEDSIARVLARPGAADLTADFGDGIPPRVICALLGMPWQDEGLVERTLHLHEQIMRWIGRGYREPESITEARAASRAINELLVPYIRERRQHPKDDFISRVWLQAPAEYGELDEEDAIAICRELYLGGADTTVHGIANSLYLLIYTGRVATHQAKQLDEMQAVADALSLLASVQAYARALSRTSVFGRCRDEGVPDFGWASLTMSHSDRVLLASSSRSYLRRALEWIRWVALRAAEHGFAATWYSTEEAFSRTIEVR